ncbi:MAG: aminotransferase class V-fold PLP-dependent enzyme [Bdellovibrionota bacterium]|nr:aminotransferase class V-fold PLP-dependent enzyme [Bdellovibrionota bacterium]
MEKLANRHYFDYNATSPHSPAVLKWLGEGDFVYANSSSGHSSGKNVLRSISAVTSDVLEHFGVSDSHSVFFHSGATEGINSIVQGMAHSLSIEGKKLHFFHSSIDHSAVTELKDYLEFYGHVVHAWNVDESAQFDFKKLKKDIESCPPGTVLVNYTYVNNEIGVVWPLDDIQSLKDETGAVIHVDAVQSPGKIDGWETLLPGLDYYTYSSHKFGGLKGVGFTFVKKDSYVVEPLIKGGGQQDGKRAGTLNTMGIISTKLALDDLKKTYKPNECYQGIEFLRKELKSFLGVKGKIIGENSPQLNSNTLFFTVKGRDSNSLLMAFDLNQMDVGIGSACSSGITAPNRILLELGHDETTAKSGLRLSFGPDLNLEKAKDYWIQIEKVLKRAIR